MKNHISEKYKKYVIATDFDGSKYYILCGADMKNGEDDYVLTDRNNKLLLFTTIEGLLAYILKGDIGIDKENTMLWAGKISKSIKPYALLDFDLKIVFENLSEVEQLNTLSSSIGVLRDFAYQTNNEKLLKISLYRPIQKLLDYFGNLYLWSGRQDDKYIYTEKTLTKQLKELHEELKKVVTIMD